MYDWLAEIGYNSGPSATLDPVVAPLTLASKILFSVAQEIAQK
jgi:hypothetical protein